MKHACHELTLKEYNYSKGDPDHSYLIERLKGFSSLGDKTSTSGDLPSFEIKNQEHQLFSSDEKGDLIIFYFNIHGNHTQWLKPGTKNKRPFFRKRLRNPTVDQKYWQPPKSGEHPYFTPSVIEKYLNRVKIDNLILVEGELKAYAGFLAGLDIIGVPSNRVPADPNGPFGKLHPELLEVITECKVENLYFLLDADVLKINPSPDKDTTRRQENFYRSVLNFRQALNEYYYSSAADLKNIYFTHIKNKFADTHKGLDDLLTGHGEVQQKKIIKDLLRGHLAEEYFSAHILNDIKPKTLRKYFGLTSASDYYEKYRHCFKGQREFIFYNCRYKWDGEKAKQVRHNDADLYARIGADWFKKINRHTTYGPEPEFTSWKISEITQDYKHIKNFRSQIPKYDAFCSIPNFNGQYSRVHNGSLNLAEPLIHKPAPGSTDNTRMFLKHIFGGAADFNQDITGDIFTVALDYLTLLHNKPLQRLPVLILVSPEQKTGKSTFIHWLKRIYRSNVVEMGNTQFQMRFNTHYASKYLICIDESFLELDKKAEKEKLKQLVTSNSIFLEFKGANLKEIPFYGTLIMCSNDADRVMAMDDNDSRWFVVRVPKIKEEDPHLEEKLDAEIPAWLNFLQNREIHHPNDSRLWFKPEHFLTEQFHRIVERTKPRISKVFEEFIKDQFLTFGISPLLMPLNYILENLNDRKFSKYTIDRTELKAYLQDELQLQPLKTRYTKIPVEITGEGSAESIQWRSGTVRPYVLHAKDFFKSNPEDFKSFLDTKKEHNIKYGLEDDYYKYIKYNNDIQMELQTENPDDLPF
jgi:hypothetical protein